MDSLDEQLFDAITKAHARAHENMERALRQHLWLEALPDWLVPNQRVYNFWIWVSGWAVR